MNVENKPKIVNVGILGFGTVGQGTWKHLEENSQFWEKILGVQVKPKRASVRSIQKERKIKIAENALTTDSESIVNDPDIDLICELIGGIEEAKELTLRAFENGKSVVTANKALICEHGEELFEAAEKAGVLAFGQASNQEQFCPNAHMTAIEDVWGPYYAERAKALVDGSWASQDTWAGMKEGHVVMSDYNTKILPADLIAEAKAMEAGIIDGTLHSFAGPIYNQDGELVVPEGSVADLSLIHI